VPCSMCQQEAADHVCVSVARCLTCKDTVCIAHLEAHNAAHKGHGHKVFFLSNQNLAQFAQSAADFDSRANPHLPLPLSCPMVRTAAPPSNTAPAQRSPCSPADSFATTLPPSLEWRDPVGYFGSSAVALSADTPWVEAEAYGSRAPWADLAWNTASLGAAAAADESQVSPLFVGNRSVLGAGAFSGVW
jgi:hypothetical protein